MNSTLVPMMSENDFVQRARLVAVDQAGAVLGHAVRQLVRDDVQRAGKVVERLPAGVIAGGQPFPEHHGAVERRAASAAPERIQEVGVDSSSDKLPMSLRRTGCTIE